jgi:DnaJ-class molecular chaperone
MADIHSSFDAEKDYYAILGVKPSDKMEEIKSAHVKLALKYHPDRQAAGVGAGSQDVSAANELGIGVDRSVAFREVSEAWGILSKTDSRRQYDAARAQYVARVFSGANHGLHMHGHAETGSSEIPESAYSTQKANYTNSVKGAASSNWKETQDKYRTEKWQNMPLHEKKAARVRAVHTPGGSFLGVIGAGVCMIGAMFVAYKVMVPAPAHSRSKGR